jgi:endonuclease-3
LNKCTKNEIGQRLVANGKKLFHDEPQFIEFSKDLESDVLTNDLENYPHAFVIGCVMDRQIKAEKAWGIPLQIKQRIGNFEFTTLRSLSQEDTLTHFTEPSPLHRFNSDMAKYCFLAIERIDKTYQGDASEIWSNTPSSAELVFRFLQFSGIGQKIATMAANILAREFKIPLRDYYSIDVSVDSHVKRVFQRLNLVDSSNVDSIVFKARVISPEFPGLVDFPCFEIGRTWCHVRNPDCGNCYMADVCPSSDQLLS